MSTHETTQRLSNDVVVSEHVSVVDGEYRYQGEIRHRPKQHVDYAACCLRCGWQHLGRGFFVVVEARKHVCDGPPIGPTTTNEPVVGEGLSERKT